MCTIKNAEASPGSYNQGLLLNYCADLKVTICGKVEIHRNESTAREMAALKKSSLCEAYAFWQENWTREAKGRELYSFFPDIRKRINRDYIQQDYIVFQMLTGH
ncbi:hypothetical protein EVAR_89927_1 [Eumeta japonica]|uniref:Uncharacterized protein n=1 Tax=Eumeta variegata TaxID=151549 RepID=A0A4C1XN20_EUMVA|nr:hypothetical protein EVAR_89927_1 [Eumeta japonica]